MFIRNDIDESTGTKLAKHMHRCPAYSPCCWLFPVSCGRMFHPKSLLSLDSSLINLCIQENHRTLQLAFKVPLSLPQPNFQTRVPAARREESSAPSRLSWPIKGTSSSPRWPTLPNICSSSATFANFHQGWKECAEVKCIIR